MKPLCIDDVDFLPTETPERQLLAAILGRAIRDLFVTYNRSGSYVFVRKLRREALSWFACKEVKPFSFIWICWHLDLRPELVIKELREANRESLKKRMIQYLTRSRGTREPA